LVEAVAKGRKGNSAPSDKDIDSIDRYVSVARPDIDLSQGFVEPVKGLYVREALANLVRQVEPASGGVLGKGARYVKLASPRSLASYDTAVYVRALGTSGMLVKSTTYGGQRIVEHFNYIRPTAKYAGAVMQAVAIIRELVAKGLPVTALVIVYPTPGTKLKRPMVLHVKGIWAYYRRIHTSAGTYYSPDVRLYFTRHVLGLRKETPYIFDLIIFYSTKQVQRPASKQELAETAMARIPPPRIVVAQAPQARPRRARAPRAVAQPAVIAPAPAEPTVMAPPPQPAPAQAPITLHQGVEAQPQGAQPQPAPQPEGTKKYVTEAQPTAPPQPQARPASLSTGRYVKQDLSFVKELISSPSTGQAFRAIRERTERRFVKEVEAQPAVQAPTQPQQAPQPTVEAQPQATDSTLNELDKWYIDLVKSDYNLTPEDKVRLIHMKMEEAKRKVNI
jgi:hypothetical protein